MKSASVPRMAASRADSPSSRARTSSRSYRVRGCEWNRCTSGPASTCEMGATYEPLPCSVWMMARAQQLQALAQRGARDAEFFGQAAFGGQGLAGLEHAVHDQAFDAFGHLVGDLAAAGRRGSIHVRPTGITTGAPG